MKFEMIVTVRCKCGHILWATQKQQYGSSEIVVEPCPCCLNEAKEQQASDTLTEEEQIERAFQHGH